MIHLSEDGWKCSLTLLVVGAGTFTYGAVKAWPHLVRGWNAPPSNAGCTRKSFAARLADEPDDSMEAMMRRNCGGTP